MRIVGITSILAGMIPLIVILILSFLTPGYQIIWDYISTIGVSEFGLYLNITLLITALLTIPFAIHIYRVTGNRWYIAAFSGLLIISMAGIGIFPADQEPMHTGFATILLLSSFIWVILIAIKTDGIYSKISLALGTIGLVSFLAHVIAFLFLEITPKVSIISPPAEWLQVLLLVFWLMYSGVIILKNNLTE